MTPLELMPFQRQGVDALKKLNGRALLADEMGLGKTPQALITAAELGCFSPPSRPVVVICPASLRLNWLKEAAQWLGYCLPASAIKVIRTNKTPLFGQLLILSYEQATSRTLELASLKPSMVILDESHYVKNKDAKRTRAIVPLCRFATRCLLLTGTPVLNRPIELWCQLEALNFSLGTYWEYAKRYCNAHPGRFGWDVSGASHVHELHQVLSRNIMVRRLKSEVLSELPAKRRVQLVVDGVGKTTNMEHITRVCTDALKSCQYDLQRTIALLRRKSSGVSDCIFKAYAELAELKVKPAQEIAVELAMAAPLVVFAHHKALLGAIATALDDASISFAIIDGSTSLNQRQKVVDDFQSGKIHVALLSITAASTGLTLTRASDMLVCELPWGPGLAKQAEDRIHRIGQKNAAVIRYLCAQGTLDDQLWSLITSKAQLTSALIDGEHSTEFANAESENLGSYWDLIYTVLVELKEKLILEKELPHDKRRKERATA